MACNSGGVTVGSGATSASVAVAKASSGGMTICGGSNDAIDDKIVSVVPVTGAAEVGTGTQNTRGVGYPFSSLKVALRLLETRVSFTNAEEV